MKSLTQEQIKEIAEELDCGFRCFWSKKDGDILFIPDFYRYPDMDTDAFAEEIEKLDNNFCDYAEIEQMKSHDNFQIMTDFIETLTDSNKLKVKLLYALNKKKPFREFMYVIDNAAFYRQKWFDFKNERIRKWVKERFDEIIKFEEKKACT